MKISKKPLGAIFLVLMLFLVSCTGLNQQEGGDELPGEEVAAEDSVPEEGISDELDELDNEEAASETVADNSQNESVPGQEDQLLIEEAAADQQQEQAVSSANSNETAVDEFQEFDQQPTEPVAAVEPSPGPTEPVSQEVQPVTEISTNVEMPAVQTFAKISSVQYKANEAGGTLVIEGDRPLTFQTRANNETNQLIVEIPNATLTEKVRRPLNMKDIAGIIGAVDSYQIADSTTARFVIQMRANTTKPFVTSEGNSILVVSEKYQMLGGTGQLGGNVGASNASSSGAVQGKQNQPAEASQLLTTKTLYEFLDKNNKFYGKKISIETVDMPVTDALRFIAEEAGINIILDPELGTPDKKVNLKMRDIPWDQAFTIILKTNGLGYVRVNDFIRITTQKAIQEEEAAAFKRYYENLERSPMSVRVFEINFIKASELAPKVEKFIWGDAVLPPDASGSTPASREKGVVFPDDRANQLVVLAREDSMNVVADVIAQFDQQPPQVLIEGRIIEASDTFSRQIGVNWSASGQDVNLGGGINLRPGIAVNNGINGGNGALTFNLGTLDVLGNLESLLALSELEGKIRILSSPRIVTLNNEKATITQKIGVPYTKTPEATTTGGVVVQPTTDFLDVPLTLDVTPQITADSSVIMNVNLTRSFLGPASTPGVPVVDSRTATTRVMVKNGQTSIIGGVYQNDTSTSTRGVPYLKDIPLIGGLFRSRENIVNKQELMIFITPRVIKGPKLSGNFGVTGNSKVINQQEEGETRVK